MYILIKLIMWKSVTSVVSHYLCVIVSNGDLWLCTSVVSHYLCVIISNGDLRLCTSVVSHYLCVIVSNGDLCTSYAMH